MNEPKCSTKNSQEYTKMLRMKKTNESFNSSYYLQSFSQLCSFNSKKIFVLLWNKKKFQPLLFCQSLRIWCCTIFSFFLSFVVLKVFFFSFLSTKSNFFELSIIQFFLLMVFDRWELIRNESIPQRHSSFSSKVESSNTREAIEKIIYGDIIGKTP